MEDSGAATAIDHFPARRRRAMDDDSGAATAIDLFPAGGFVRLRARRRRMYVHADEDAKGVSLRPLGASPSISAVWMCQHCFVEGEDEPYLLLQTAAYGRYLVGTNQEMPNGIGFRVVQCDYNSANIDPWFAILIAHLPRPPLIAQATFLDALGELLGPPDPEPARLIRYTIANDDGECVQELADWPEFIYEGRSASDLMTRVRLRETDGRLGSTGIILCIRAGLNARLIPLVTDLPRNEDPLDLVVYTSGSRAASNLRYPHYQLPRQ